MLTMTQALFPDTVTADGVTFHRRRAGVYAGTPYRMRFAADRPLSDAEITLLAQQIGYAYRSTICGEPLGWPQRDSDRSFVVAADMTKTARDDLGIALEAFEDLFPTVIAEGSPVRKTDRAGAGTKGTRLVPAFPDSSMTVHVYYDDVYTW